MFDDSFPAWAFLFCYVEVEISSRTLIPLFRPGSVHSGSASWDDCGLAFPDELRVTLFLWCDTTPYLDSIAIPLRLRRSRMYWCIRVHMRLYIANYLPIYLPASLPTYEEATTITTITATPCLPLFLLILKLLALLLLYKCNPRYHWFYMDFRRYHY